MKEEQVKQLLERYWMCETSLDEELALQRFFSGDNLPEELKIYQPLFLRNSKQLEIKASKKLWNKINRPLRMQFYQALQAAASVLILLTIGIGFYTHYQQEKQMDKLFSDTYSTPEEAAKETEQIVARVSGVLKLIQEKNMAKMQDSISIKGSDSIFEKGIELKK
ncbi:MAG: hypothetical protein LBH32_12200 [Dysgonamonadaceae bacterium]|jgi:hypothetical protein|nr:hypothetical protein [Dysgonamonadaceae bacterium]